MNNSDKITAGDCDQNTEDKEVKKFYDEIGGKEMHSNLNNLSEE